MKRGNTYTRALSLLLTLCMLLALLPAAALAADGTAAPGQAAPLGAGESVYAIGEDITRIGLDLQKDRPAQETVYLAGEGTVTYIPAQGEEPDRLILDNATIDYDGGDFAIRLPQSAVIELVGANTIRAGDGGGICLSRSAEDQVFFDEELKIVSRPGADEERGALSVYAEDGGITNYSGKITLDSVELCVEATGSYPCALGVWGDLTVQSSEVFLKGTPYWDYDVLLAEAIDIDADSSVQVIDLDHEDDFTSRQTICCTGLALEGALYTNGSIDTDRYINAQNENSAQVGSEARLTATYVSTGAMTVAPGAKVHTVHVWTPDDEDDFRYTLTVYGAAALPEYNFYEDAAYSLVMTEGSAFWLLEGQKLDISEGTNDLSKGSFTIDGTLVLPDSFTPEDIEALVTEGDGFIMAGDRAFTTSDEQYFIADDLDFSLPAEEGGWKEDAALETDGYTWQEREDRYTLTVRQLYHRGYVITLPTDKDVELFLGGDNYLGQVTYDYYTCEGEAFLSRLTITGDGRGETDISFSRFYDPPLKYPNITIGAGAVLTVSSAPLQAVAAMPNVQDTPEGEKLVGGDFVLDGGQLTVRITERSYARGLVGSACVFANTVTIRKGSLDAVAPIDYSFMALSVWDSVTLEGGDVRLAGDIGMSASSLIMRGGTLEVNPDDMGGEDAKVGILLYTEEENGLAGFDMTGGKLTAQGGTNALFLCSHQKPTFRLAKGVAVSPKGAAYQVASREDYLGDTMWIASLTTDAALELGEEELFPENGCTKLELDGTRAANRSSSGSRGGDRGASSDVVTDPDGSVADSPATPEPVSNAKAFSDVPAGAWFADAVAFVSAREMMVGTSDTAFSPGMTATRGMVATLLARYEGQDTAGGEHWYDKGMAWAREAGISDGTNPEADITREQLATILWRYAGRPAASEDLSRFQDSDTISEYAITPMRWAVESKIVFGKGDDILDPDGKAQRCEVAAMIMRFLEARGQK